MLPIRDPTIACNCRACPLAQRGTGALLLKSGPKYSESSSTWGTPSAAASSRASVNSRFLDPVRPRIRIRSHPVNGGLQGSRCCFLFVARMVRETRESRPSFFPDEHSAQRLLGSDLLLVRLSRPLRGPGQAAVLGGASCYWWRGPAPGIGPSLADGPEVDLEGTFAWSTRSFTIGDAIARRRARTCPRSGDAGGHEGSEPPRGHSGRATQKARSRGGCRSARRKRRAPRPRPLRRWWPEAMNNSRPGSWWRS